jgi:hypothetical protein
MREVAGKKSGKKYHQAELEPGWCRNGIELRVWTGRAETTSPRNHLVPVPFLIGI